MTTTKCQNCGSENSHREGDTEYCSGCGAVLGPAFTRQNYWTEEEAGTDIEMPRCVHGKPRNVFCGKCES